MTRKMRRPRRNRRIARLSIHIFATTIRLCLAALIAGIRTRANSPQCKIELPLELLLHMELLCRAVEFLAIGSESAAELFGGHVYAAEFASVGGLCTCSEVH
jgi:hypothetical protein